MARTGFRVTGAATDTAVIAAPGANKRIVIQKLMFTVSAAATVSFSDGLDATATRIIDGDFAANGGGVWDSAGSQMNYIPVAVLTANTAFNVTNSAGNLKGSVTYDVVG